MKFNPFWIVLAPLAPTPAMAVTDYIPPPTIAQIQAGPSIPSGQDTVMIGGRFVPGDMPPKVCNGTAAEPSDPGRWYKDRWWVCPTFVPNVMDYGAKGDGSTNDASAFNVLAQQYRTVFVPAGAYCAPSNLNFAGDGGHDQRLIVDPGATFPCSGKLDAFGLSPNHAEVVDVEQKTWSGTGQDGDQFVRSSIVTGSRRGVAITGFAHAKVAGSGGFAFNPICRASANLATAVCIEVDPQVMVAGGQAWGVIVSASGLYPTGTPAFQLQGNDPGVTFLDGLRADNGDQPIFTGSFLKSRGSAAEYGVNLSGLFSIAEYQSPQFRVGATPAGVNAQAEVAASSAGVVTVKARGTADPPAGMTAAVNTDLRLTNAGSGKVTLADSGGTERVAISTNGVGFQGSAPQAKPTITGCRGTSSASTKLGELLQLLENYGLINDTTSAC